MPRSRSAQGTPMQGRSWSPASAGVRLPPPDPSLGAPCCSDRGVVLLNDLAQRSATAAFALSLRRGEAAGGDEPSQPP
eukprot:5692001-Alexandrium_andersonii.AAC.1